MDHELRDAGGQRVREIGSESAGPVAGFLLEAGLIFAEEVKRGRGEDHHRQQDQCRLAQQSEMERARPNVGIVARARGSSVRILQKRCGRRYLR